MNIAALVFPVLPGKTEADVRSIATMLTDRPDEYRASRERAGITLERVYMMNTPTGNFVIAYFESLKPIAETLAAPASSDLAIDKDFVRKGKEVHGVDLTTPPPGPTPEVIGEWSDPAVTERKRGFAFTVPVIPGKEEVGRAFAREAFVTRRDELTADRRALPSCVEVVTLQYTPAGPVFNVYIEADDPVEANRKFAASTTPYNTWFKSQLATLFPPEIDFSKPVPPVVEIFDSEHLLAAR
jgi:hypothetical protein